MLTQHLDAAGKSGPISLGLAAPFLGISDGRAAGEPAGLGCLNPGPLQRPVLKPSAEGAFG